MYGKERPSAFPETCVFLCSLREGAVDPKPLCAGENILDSLFRIKESLSFRL